MPPGKPHVDITAAHGLRQINGGGDGRAARTGLVDEAILEMGLSRHKPGAVFGHQQLALVRGGLGRAGGDLARIADGIYYAHEVHIRHGDTGRDVGKRHQRVRDRYHPVGIAASTAE